MNSKYNIGIEKLRIYSMLCITVLHILGHGGVISAAGTFSLHYELAWLLKCFAICGVNCYGLISGYVLIGEKIKISKIISLWVQVLFYSCFLSFGSSLITHSKIGLKQGIGTLFPILSKQYWYPTVYIGLYFFIPYINLLYQKFTMIQVKKLIYVLVIITSVIPTIINHDIMDVPTGSFTWLSILFLIGAFIKVYGIRNLLPKCISPPPTRTILLVGYIVFSILLYISHFCIERITLYFFKEIRWGNWFILYTSPIVLFQALFLITYFVKGNYLKPAISSWVKALSSCSLAVYLVQDNYYFKLNIAYGIFEWMVSINAFRMVLGIVTLSIIVYICVVPIEKLRQKILLNNITKILLNYADKKINFLINI